MRAIVDLTGTIDRPRARIDLAARNLQARALPHAADVDARLDVDMDGVRVQQVQAHAGSTSLQAAGRYSWRGPFDARFEVNQRDLSEIASQFRLPVALSGSARLEGTISGTVSSRVRSGQAGARPVGRGARHRTGRRWCGHRNRDGIAGRRRTDDGGCDGARGWWQRASWRSSTAPAIPSPGRSRSSTTRSAR